MEGILVIVLWCVVFLVSIGAYMLWNKINILKNEKGISEDNEQIKSKYGQLKLITLFILSALLTIAAVSLIEATDSANYFKF